MKFNFINADWKNSPLLQFVAIIYLLMLLTFIFIEYSVLLYLVCIISFLIIATFIFQAEKVPFINSQVKQKVFVIFGAALILRFVLLYQDQIITKDIISYTNRARFMLDGQIPYLDFYGGSKPPLYNYLIYLMGTVLGPSPVRFRGFFSVIDAIVALTVFYGGRYIIDERWGYKLGLIYALSPLNIITIGLSGHYEPVIIVFLVPAFVFFFKKQYHFSGLCLGISFAFKIFPVVVLPFILVAIKSWKQRIEYVIFFSIPMILSLIPLLIISPEALRLFFHEEGGWGGALSFSALFYDATGVEYIFGIKYTWIIMGIFMVMVLFMFYSWTSYADKSKHVTLWFKIMLIIMIISYSIKIPIAFIYYNADITVFSLIKFLIIPLVLFYALAIFCLKKYWPLLIPGNIHHGDHIIITSIFAIMLFIQGIPNFAPWYMIWYLPLLLLVKMDRIRMTILWLMFWHHTGVGVSLLPGLFPVN